MGMCLCVGDFQEKVNRKTGITGAIIGEIFLVLSILFYKLEISAKGSDFLLGLIACISVVMLISFLSKTGRQNRIVRFFTKYTMPIYLMHTIFAASSRIVLLKMSIENSVVQVIIGIVISFTGPIVATKIMERFAWLDFFLNPGKYVGTKSGEDKPKKKIYTQKWDEN